MGRGLFSTFHANHALLRYPLDHVFHSPDVALISLGRLGHVGSDHFPMRVEVALASDRLITIVQVRPPSEWTSPDLPELEPKC